MARSSDQPVKPIGGARYFVSPHSTWTLLVRLFLPARLLAQQSISGLVFRMLHPVSLPGRRLLHAVTAIMTAHQEHPWEYSILM